MYLRKIIVVADVAVLTIEAIKIVFKPVFLKQVHLLKPLDIFMTLLKYARKRYVCKKKGNTGTRKRMWTKSVSRYKKLLITQVENLHAVSHFNTKHLVL